MPIDEAVRMADAAERGVVVLSDTGDTVFGGAAGDSNLILEAMLRLGIASPALVPMIAPDAVARLVAAGRGRDASRCRSAGDAATAFFTPLEVTGTVRTDRRRHHRAHRQPPARSRHGPDRRSSRSGR